MYYYELFKLSFFSCPFSTMQLLYAYISLVSSLVLFSTFSGSSCSLSLLQCYLIINRIPGACIFDISIFFSSLVRFWFILYSLCMRICMSCFHSVVSSNAVSCNLFKCLWLAPWNGYVYLSWKEFFHHSDFEIWLNQPALMTLSNSWILDEVTQIICS